jgi:OMF family outer membrane factor
MSPRRWPLLLGLALAAEALALPAALSTALAAAQRPRPGGTDPVLQLERSWQRLDAELRALDRMLPAEREVIPAAVETTPPLPASLLRANRPAAGALRPEQEIPAAPLALPSAESLRAGRVGALSLEQAVALGFAHNPALQGQRELVAAALAELQAALGSYWPRISAYATGGSGQSSLSTNAPVGNGGLGLGPQFAPNGLATPAGGTTAGAFYVPSGGAAYLNEATNGFSGGLQLDLALLDFARTPRVRAARARLRAARHTYATGLRSLQLQVSEAYYRLQQADQTVRIRDAAVRNDLVILADSLDLKRAGLVPRLDVLRRRAIEANDQELLIQALADRAVARRQLAVVLNLAPDTMAEASDPIRLQPRWPLDLEASLLAAYADNPELEMILATREALARERDATAAALLPRLSLFASAGGSGSNVTQFDISTSNGGCCGTTVIPVNNSSGYDWSIGLAVRWLLFDAGSSAGEARALARRVDAAAQLYAAQRNDIRQRLEQAFFNHEASLARLASARRGVAASLEAFRDVRLRYQSGLSSELELSSTQEQLIAGLVRRLNATVEVNITYARLLRELLPVPRDPNTALAPQLQWAAPR